MNARRYVPLAEWPSVHKRPMRVAILKRRSKDDPDTKSLLVQHDAIVRWLNTLPAGSWTCDMRPADQGGDNYEQIVSAWKGKGQHRLLTQIMSRLSEYDVVVVYRMDRFGRNVLTVLTALEEMREAGVRLFSVEEGLDTANPASSSTVDCWYFLPSNPLISPANGSSATSSGPRTSGGGVEEPSTTATGRQ